MSKQIHITEEAVQSLLKNALEMQEDLTSRIYSLERALNGAETLGWTDSRFYEIKDEFKEIIQKLNEGLVKNEEIVIPKLKKVLTNLENF